jgi:hypothetical protein
LVEVKLSKEMPKQADPLQMSMELVNCWERAALKAPSVLKSLFFGCVNAEKREKLKPTVVRLLSELDSSLAGGAISHPADYGFTASICNLFRNSEEAEMLTNYLMGG